MNLVDDALAHAQHLDSISYFLALGAGVTTSIGPCVAPRYVAVTTMAGSSTRGRCSRLISFVAGTVTIYVAIACAGWLVMCLARASTFIYWGIATALVVSGLFSLSNAEHSCAGKKRSPSTVGAAFLLGAATSSAISPCCAPILLALGALSAPATHTLPFLGLVVAFTIGHLAPLVVLFLIAGAARGLMTVHRAAVTTVSAGVTIALGIYYAVMA